MSHDQLRQRNRRRRAALDPAQLESAASALTSRLVALDAYREARRVAAYLAIKGEIDLGAIIINALKHGKEVYLPVIRGQQMFFVRYVEGQAMQTSEFGLTEPVVDQAETLDPSALDLVLAPLTVFDPAGNRIGQGGGYYDRSFAFRRQPGVTKPLLVGVAHELQKVNRIDPNPWDVRLDLVATDIRLYRAPV